MIVMSIDDRVGENLDPAVEYIVVVFNATDEAWSFGLDEEFASPMVLHPVLTDSADEMTRNSAYQDGRMYVPAMTTAVFLAEEVAEEAPEETVSDELGVGMNDALIPFVILGAALLAMLGIWLMQRSGKE